jgi:hypothetical protein
MTGSRLAIAITAVIMTTVLVAGGLAGALPGTKSVFNDDIGTGAVNSRTIKNNNVKSKDIRNNTIQSKDIRDGTISTISTISTCGTVDARGTGGKETISACFVQRRLELNIERSDICVIDTDLLAELCNTDFGVP